MKVAILMGGGEDHVLQFILIFRCHGNDVGEAAKIRNVEQTVMRGAVVGGKAGAIHAENHRQVLQANVVMNAVVGALEKCGVDRNHRVIAHGRHAGGKHHGVFLLGNAHINVPFGWPFPNASCPCLAGHGGRDAHEVVVLPESFTIVWPNTS